MDTPLTSPSPQHSDALEHATHRLLQIAALFGLTGSSLALLTTLQQRSEIDTVLLAAAWSAGWAAVTLRPQAIIPLLRHWLWTVPLLAVLSTTTILVSGGFDSLLKAEANWIGWAAPVVLGTSASLSVAAILATGLLAALLLDGRSLEWVVTGSDRYTAVTDILNPLVIVLMALAVTGVFRLVLAGVATTLWRAREGEGASTPALSAVLAGPAAALPAGESEVARDEAQSLSPAEHDIVERLATGQTPQQIALARGVRDDTVYDQISTAKRKVGAATIEHLVALAWRP